MKRIEFLFPEVANLYGDPFNVRYMKQSIAMSEEVEVVETTLTEEPRFVKGDVDMIYLGSMSEKSQELVIKKLRPYKGILEALIEEGKVLLFTGNAIEILGDRIEGKKHKIEGLGITGLTAKRDMMSRYNTLFHGTMKVKGKDMTILGHKATFSFSFGGDDMNYCFKSIKGCGNNKESEFEGYRRNNLFATYLLGPLLVMNPEFTKYLEELMGVKEPKAAFEEEAQKCFDIRLQEFKKESTNYLQ